MSEKKLPADIIRRKVRILQKGVKIHGGNTRRAVIEGKPILELYKEDKHRG